jgi:hypothetical protein
MGYVVSGASSREVQRTAEDFGAFHVLYLAGTSPLLACISSLLLLTLRSLCLELQELRGNLPARRQSGSGPHG